MKVYFYIKIKDFEIVNYIKCNPNFTIREFLNNVELVFNDNSYEDYIPSLKDIHYVYLKGNKLEEWKRLENYSEEIQNIPLIITNDPSILMEKYLPFVNLNDYKNIKFYSHSFPGTTFKAFDKKTKKNVLIMPISFDTRESFEYLIRYRIAATLDHCGIVKILGFRYPLNSEEKKNTNLLNIQFSDKNKSYEIDLTKFIVVFEFVENGSCEPYIREYIKSKGEKNNIMNPTIRSKLIYGVASIMKYVHQKKIVHHDLLLSHILCDENFEPKISDFELSKFDQTKSDVENESHPSPNSIAPDLFADNDDDEEYDYVLSSDIYSYGVLIYQFFSNQIKFDDSNQNYSPQQCMMLIREGKRPKRPENIPDPYWELIQKCWKQDCKSSPTLEEFVEELKQDKYAIEEYGMKTSLDELREYQQRIDFCGSLELISGG